LTVSCSTTLLVAPLLVPVTVKIEDDVVRTGCGVGLPPHAAIDAMRNAAKNIMSAGRGLVRPPKKTRAATPPAIANGSVLKGKPWFRAWEVVATVTVTGTVEDPVARAGEGGFTLQVEPAGAPRQLRFTVPVKPSDDKMRL
jgi:hypothetical protein